MCHPSVVFDRKLKLAPSDCFALAQDLIDDPQRGLELSVVGVAPWTESTVLRSDRLGNRCIGAISKGFTLDEDMKNGLGTEVGLVPVSREDNRGDGSLIEAFEESVVHLLERDKLYTRMPNNLGYESSDSLDCILLDRLFQHPGDTIGVYRVTVPIRVSVLEEWIEVRCEGPHGQ